MSHSPEQIREMVCDALTGVTGHLRHYRERPQRTAVLLYQHSNSDEPLYSLARFLRETTFAPVTELDYIIRTSRITEQQRYRLEYALWVLRGRET